MKTPQSKSTKLDELDEIIFNIQLGARQFPSSKWPPITKEAKQNLLALVESKVLEGRRDELLKAKAFNTSYNGKPIYPLLQDYFDDCLTELEATPKERSEK